MGDELLGPRPDVGGEDGGDREDQRERRDGEAEDVHLPRLLRLHGGIPSLFRELFVVPAGVLAEGLQLGAVQLYRLAQEPERLGLDGPGAHGAPRCRGGVLDVL